MPDVLSAKSNVKVTFESGKSFSPIMFDAVLKRFTPDLPIGISSRPRCVQSMFCCLISIAWMTYNCSGLKYIYMQNPASQF